MCRPSGPHSAAAPRSQEARRWFPSHGRGQARLLQPRFQTQRVCWRVKAPSPKEQRLHRLRPLGRASQMPQRAARPLPGLGAHAREQPPRGSWTLTAQDRARSATTRRKWTRRRSAAWKEARQETYERAVISQWAGRLACTTGSLPKTSALYTNNTGWTGSRIGRRFAQIPRISLTLCEAIVDLAPRGQLGNVIQYGRVLCERSAALHLQEEGRGATVPIPATAAARASLMKATAPRYMKSPLNPSTTSREWMERGRMCG